MGLFDKLFGGKKDKPVDQYSVDYIRVNLLAKLGEENLDNGNYPEAIKSIQEFFELMGRNSFPDLEYLVQPCYFNLALSHSNIGDHDNAIIYWSKYIHADKSNFDAYFERLKSYFALNKLKEALLDIDSALALDPSRDDLYINKGIAYIKMGNKIEARKALSKAVAMGNMDAQKYIDNHC